MNRKLKIGVFGGYRGMTMITVLMGHPDAELVAVITAALMAYEQKTGKALVVRSVRRSGAWGRTARQEQVYSRY